jgi:predicted phosphoribosyltransferase
MIDTGGTMRMAARALLDAGADKILAAATHGIFSGDAIERFREDREGHRSPRKPARFKAKGKEKTVRGTSISLRERWRDL